MKMPFGINYYVHMAQIKMGDPIRVRAYGGEVLERRVAGSSERVVYVSTSGEWEAANREGRVAVAVGFPWDAVVRG